MNLIEGTNSSSSSSSSAAKQKLRVLCPVTNQEGKTFWRQMGVAFTNRDGSINLYLDGLPLNGKLQVREWDDPPWEKRDGGNGAGSQFSGRTPSGIEARDPQLPF